MEVTFGDPDLDDMEANENCKSSFDKSVLRAYRLLMRYIRDATDERDLRAWKAKHFEKLGGDRSHQYSMRIKDQWRLVFEIKKATPKNIIHVVSVTDYHRG
jgi:proteic killer suppression protein